MAAKRRKKHKSNNSHLIISAGYEIDTEFAEGIPISFAGVSAANEK
jgi:hypothetical protein